MVDDLREDEVRSQLHAAIGRGPEPVADWDGLEGRLVPAARRRRRRRGSAVALVGVAAAVVVALLLARSRGEQVRTGPVGPTASSIKVSPPISIVTPTGSTLPATSRTSVVATVAMPTGTMVATADGAWIVNTAQTGLTHVDLAGRVVGHVSWPYADSHFGTYGGPVYVASGEGKIWVAFWATGTLLRIDPVTMAVTGRNELKKGQDAGFEVEHIAAGSGHVWVTVCCDRAPNQRLLRIDPVTLAVDAKVALPGDGESEAVVAGPQGIFVTGEDFGTVAQIDPSGTRIIREIAVPGGAGTVALGSQVWVLGHWEPGSSSGTDLYSIDPTTGVVHLVMPLVSGVQQLAASGPELWGVQAPPSGLVVDLGGALEETPGIPSVVEIAVDGDRLWSLDATHLVERKIASR